MKTYHTQASCHPDRVHAAKGLCFSCYSEKFNPKAKRATCHPGRVAHVKGLCRSCYDKELKKRDPSYAERQKTNTARWAELNKDRIKTHHREYMSQGRVKKRSRARARDARLSAFGMTTEDELRILDSQGNCCPICGVKPKRLFDVDHDHTTGEFRGFICHRCNKGLGLLGDTIEGLENALAYLRRTTKD